MAARLVALMFVLVFAAGCYMPPRRAKSCSTCSRASRPASYATHIK